MRADLLLHVVDGSDADPEGQIRAVRTVLAEIGAAEVAEQMVINKVDRAEAATLAALRTSTATRSSCRPDRARASTELRMRIEARLPRPAVEVRALVPYDRGDLVNRIHQLVRSSSRSTPTTARWSWPG